MKTAIKTIVFLLTLCMLLSAGCAQQAPVESNNPTDSAQPGQSTASATEQSAAPSERAIKDELVVVLKGEPSNIDPHGNGELVAFTVQTAVYDTLVTKDVDGNVVPALATSWEEVDDKTIRFHLRDDVIFHNGDKMTAEDVAFSIKRATEKPSSSSIFSAFDGENVKAVDEYTVDIAGKSPFAGMLNYLCSTRGQILCKAYVEQVGDNEAGRAPMGTGPFMFKNWETGTSITVERNENYWGETSAYKTLTFKFITEAATRAIEIESGNADIILDPSTSDLPRLVADENLNVVTGPSYGISYVAFNIASDACSDIRVRQALSLAVDTTAVVEAVYGEYANPAESVIPSTVFAYKSQGTHEYDPEKAKALLAEAGYETLTLKFSVPDGAEYRDIAEAIQYMWSQVGVTAEISISSMSEHIASGRRGEFDVSVSAANFTTGDPGHALADFDTRAGSWFYPVDSSIDPKLDEGMCTYESGARAAIYEEIQEYITNQYYMIPCANKTVSYVTTTSVENFTFSPSNTPNFVSVIPYAN